MVGYTKKKTNITTKCKCVKKVRNKEKCNKNFQKESVLKLKYLNTVIKLNAL